MPEEPVDDALFQDLAALAAAAGGAAAEPVVLASRAEGVLVRVGAVVAKAHASTTSPTLLEARVSAAAELRGIFAPPLPVPPGFPAERRYVTRGRGRPVTLWPYGRPVAPDRPADAPWVPAATLLARLHSAPSLRLPPAGGPARAVRAVSRLVSAVGVSHADRGAVMAAWSLLPHWVTGFPGPPGIPPLLGFSFPTHGDWHLGQLVDAGDGWRLIDVDDLGVGPAVWDLARPASWFAIGLLDESEFGEFLGTYAEAGGRAVPPADPWPVLDVPARALTVQAAAIGLVEAARGERPLREVEEALVEACRRMTGVAMLHKSP